MAALQQSTNDRPSQANLKMKRKIPTKPNYLPIVNYYSQPLIDVPNSARVAIDLKKSPPTATPLLRTDSPFRENRTDVILTKKNYYLFENRWKFLNELVDYDAFQFWDIDRFDYNKYNLKRIKI